MLRATIYKDIGEYTEKVVGKMSARTLACLSGGVAVSFGAAVFDYFVLGVAISDAVIPVMTASMPFWLLGFWRPKGLKAEEYVPMRVRHALKDGVIVYESLCLRALSSPVKESKIGRSARRAARRKGAERNVSGQR